MCVICFCISVQLPPVVDIKINVFTQAHVWISESELCSTVVSQAGNDLDCHNCVKLFALSKKKSRRKSHEKLGVTSASLQMMTHSSFSRFCGFTHCQSWIQFITTV